MPSFYAVPYTIHFDDTMAYGSHHFLTGFKFQCAAREAFLFGQEVFDSAGVKEALERIHLLTLDAYSRNLNSAMLGDRIAILLTLEEWGQASARFCYRAVDAKGRRICAGFQMLVSADAETGSPCMLPEELSKAMDKLRAIEEPYRKCSFRERALSGGKLLDEIFNDDICQLAVAYLKVRHPAPGMISSDSLKGDLLSTLPSSLSASDDTQEALTPTNASFTLSSSDEANLVEYAPDIAQDQSREDSLKGSESNSGRDSECLVFAGQGSFDAELMRQRIDESIATKVVSLDTFRECIKIVQDYWKVDANVLLKGNAKDVSEAVRQSPQLSQIGIHFQNVLGGYMRLRETNQGNATQVMGHSFGEIAAFTVAGCLGLADSVRAVCSRGVAVGLHAPPEQGLLAVLGSHEIAVREMSAVDTQNCVIAGRNHLEQCVVSGPLSELRLIQTRLSEKGTNSVFVASPTSFHHPCLSSAAAAWLDDLRQLNWLTPELAIFTPIGRRHISPQEDFAEILANQLLTPFDFYGALHDCAANGIKTFIDIGSTGAIAKMMERSGEPDWKVHRYFSQPAAVHSKEIPSISIVSAGCILPAGATSPELLHQAIENQELGIVDMRLSDPDWEQDFYSPTLEADRSTSCLFGRVRDGDIVAPVGLDSAWFEGLSRTQKLLAIGLTPCLTGLRDAKRIVCLVGATADGFEDQDEALSWIYAGIIPLNSNAVIQSPETSQQQPNYRVQTPHEAVQEVVDYLIGKGTEVILVDAACASSLYSVSLGMNLLENDQADAVIAGGVFCPGPGNSCLFSQFKGTTSTGCRPFDKDSNGVVFSEGAAFITLRKQIDAQNLNLSPLATIQGMGLSSDGRSSSANVPQSRGQILSLERAYQRYSLAPESIVAIEGHGTSTPVGDSTEIDTLHQFFGRLQGDPIPVHSLKGTLGHAGWAAGSASIIAAIMYMTYRRFPGQAFFRTPSEAVTRSADRLQISPSPIELNNKALRIAINGFGFGGANAHLVLESPESPKSSRVLPNRNDSSTSTQTAPSADDLTPVIVAIHELTPDDSAGTGSRFTRSSIDLSKDFRVLPELLDDMDISQKLAALLGKATIAKLTDFDEQSKATTSIVLAMGEKTERGVEATFRVLYPRMVRRSNNQQIKAKLATVREQARPSGAYTLQCMMPNVASGRAALLLNTNGPNFVVDAGRQSLKSAFDCAKLLLQCGPDAGTNVVLVEAIKANSFSYPNQQLDNAESECAAAFAVTTKAYAAQKKWPILQPMSDAVHLLEQTQESTLAGQIQKIQNSFLKNNAPSPEALQTSQEKSLTLNPQSLRPEIAPPAIHPTYTPLWVSKPLNTDSAKPEASPENQTTALANSRFHQPDINAANFQFATGTLIIARAQPQLIAELVSIHGTATCKGILLIGDDANKLVDAYPGYPMRAVSFGHNDEQSQSNFERILSELDVFRLKHIIVLDKPESWKLDEILEASVKNDLCEATFLTLRHLHPLLEERQVTVWQVVLRGWNQCLHPSTGPIAGMFKAIRREYPGLHCGSLYFGSANAPTPTLQSNSLPQSLQKLYSELATESEESEICYLDEQRMVRRLTRVDSKDRQGPGLPLDKNSVVLATGGAKGVTAVMLEALANGYGCNIIAFGRSPLEEGPADKVSAETDFYRQLLLESPKPTPVEMKRRFEVMRARWEAFDAVERLRSAGSTVEYHVVDVNNAKQVDEHVAQIAERYGRIDLVLHGAGVQYSKKLKDRSLKEFRQTYHTKVSGLNNLYRSVSRHVKNEVAFHPLTSAFSIFGNDGQHDYGAANETMDRTSELARIHSSNNWFSIAWLAWDGIGMTRGSEYQALAKQRGLSGVTPIAGQQIFIAALTGQTDTAINVPMSNSEHCEYNIQTVPTSLAPSSTTQVYEFNFSAADFPCLPDHLVRGIPTVPGAWILDAFVKSALSCIKDQRSINSVTLDDTQFMRFVKPTHDRDPNIRVVIEQNYDQFTAFLVTDVRHSSGRLLLKDVVCAKSVLRFSQSLVHEATATNPQTQAFPQENLQDRPILSDPYCEPGARVELSGEFDCIRNIRIGEQMRSAILQPSVYERWPAIIPATELDSAWRVGAMHAGGENSPLFAPTSIERIWLPIRKSHHSPPAGHGWSIQSTAPEITQPDTAQHSTDQSSAFWRRTDVCDAVGTLQLRVHGAKARQLS